ncbi:hypothetical protein ACIQYW_16180 [Rhodococcus erythropolis]|uniref:hypothetical protein n=1 Tax=Rhodococcus baikonurensis TaxID=172041 RepID=UPI0013718A06|nr:hypothetical protein [uncultured Rhodococcus sp.]MYV30741.1 hypothetical protein [Rhodococcus erythropolis]
MAGEHTRVNRDIWSSDEFLDLSGGAQHLYFILWTHPHRSFCGSVEWHPGRLAAFASDLTAELVNENAIELSEKLFLCVDLDTEEALIRSWIKHDGLYRQPNMAVAMAKDRAGLASRGLRGVVVREVAKLRVSEPDLPAWKRDQVINLLGQNSVDPAELWAAHPWRKGPRNPSVKGSVNPSGKGSVNPLSSPSGMTPPTTAPTPNSTNSNYKKSGYVSREHYEATRTDPPPKLCSQHIDNPTSTPCRPCGEARQAHADWEKSRKAELTSEQSKQAQARAELIAEAIQDCNLCNVDGYFGTTVCSHDPEMADRQKRGMAGIREQMGWKA